MIMTKQTNNTAATPPIMRAVWLGASAKRGNGFIERVLEISGTHTCEVKSLGRCVKFKPPQKYCFATLRGERLPLESPGNFLGKEGDFFVGILLNGNMVIRASMGLSLEINHGVFHEKHLPGVSKPWNATPAKADHLAQPTPTVRPGPEPV
jgi:hypothetical protein